MRAAFLGDNPSLGRVNAQTGAVTGPVADLVKELARRLGVPYKLIPVPNAREVTARLLDHSADVGFMAYNAGRAADVDFTAPWLLMPNSYLVRADSPILKVADADRAGVRIMAAKNDTQDVYLSAHLKNTSVTQIPKVPEPEGSPQPAAGRENRRARGQSPAAFRDCGGQPPTPRGGGRS